MGQTRILVLLLCVVAVALGQREPEAHPPVGRIRGSIMKSRLNNTVYAFRGIRYAEPPIGQRRFRAPVPITQFREVFDASKEGPSCVRIGGLPVEMSEDCLRLNVYTRQLQSESGCLKKPVMVFFHPGGFYSFTAKSDFFGPQYILDKDIVLVTVNYRLGSLGFLSTGDEHAPGNAAMKDQVAALRWVQRNIAAFGGDPSSVTIAGYSAGSISVLLHMLSPMSRNLFSRAIAMSAGITPTLEIPHHQRNLAVRQAQMLNCPTETNQAMIECLRQKPTQNYSDTVDKFFDWYGDPILVWMPVIEPEVPGEERFLPENPFNMIRQRKIHDVPLIIGVTKEEFGAVMILIEAGEARGERIYEQFNNNWETIAPISFLYERGTPRSAYISRELKNFYFNGQNITEQNGQGLGKLYMDTVTVFPVHRSAKLYATYSREPVYFYEFSYAGRYSYYKRADNTTYGAAHHDDMQYLFYMQVLFPFFEEDAPEIPMVERYTSMWTNFMNTSEPIPRNDPVFQGVTWERFDPAKDNYLEINLNPKMRAHFHTERMQLMDRLFPLPPLPHKGGHNVKH